MTLASSTTSSGSIYTWDGGTNERYVYCSSATFSTGKLPFANTKYKAVEFIPYSKLEHPKSDNPVKIVEN